MFPRNQMLRKLSRAITNLLKSIIQMLNRIKKLMRRNKRPTTTFSKKLLRPIQFCRTKNFVRNMTDQFSASHTLVRISKMRKAISIGVRRVPKVVSLQNPTRKWTQKLPKNLKITKTTMIFSVNSRTIVKSMRLGQRSWEKTVGNNWMINLIRITSISEMYHKKCSTNMTHMEPTSTWKVTGTPRRTACTTVNLRWLEPGYRLKK